MTAEDIYQELWYGVMAQFVNGMEDADRWAVSIWIADQKPEKDTRDSGVPLCEKSAPLKSDPARDWPGLSKDDPRVGSPLSQFRGRSNQHAEAEQKNQQERST